MAYQRQGIPPGWTWRDGRPRWIPSPALRKAGWKGRDLKDARQAWLARGASIDACARLVEAVAAWRAGRLVPAEFAGSAPPAAGQQPGAGLPAPLADRRTIGALVDAYLLSREFTAYRNKGDRKSKLSRFQDVLAGYAVQLPRDAPEAKVKAYQAARLRVRGFSIDTLEPPSFDDAPDTEEAQGPLYSVYWKLHDKAGPNMAHGVMADVSAWLSWCVKRRAIRENWARLVDRQTPPGRIRTGSWAELAALIKAAEARGLPSIADSIILGVDLSWSQADRLALTWAQIGADGLVKGTRIKTGRKGATPLLKGLGLPRLAVIRQRQKERYGENVKPTHVLICELTDKPWKADFYRHKFAEVRALAAQACPSVADLHDQDLRDTAITVAFQAGLDEVQIASRSLHSLKRIRDVLDKHYTEIGQEIADAGADKLNAYLAGKGITL